VGSNLDLSLITKLDESTWTQKLTKNWSKEVFMDLELVKNWT